MSQYGPKSDINKAGWEEAEFPALCNTCLGPNPFVRMQKQAFGKECKICTRPFTIFTWCPGQGMRYKKTEICQTCAKVKNVCQTCLLDLQYGLPVQVRDAALGSKVKAPSSDINREYFAQNMDGKLEGSQSLVSTSLGREESAGKEILKKLARSDPYYKRNRPHLCSFYAKGGCNRGDACPFTHELPKTNELSKQNLQDRYYGQNDPVARKIMRTYTADTALAPPDDHEITSLFLTSLPPTAAEESVRAAFTPSAQATIRSVVVVPASKVAFVNFRDRKAAELAAEGITVSGGLEVDGSRVGVKWGRSKPKKGVAGAAAGSKAVAA